MIRHIVLEKVVEVSLPGMEKDQVLFWGLLTFIIGVGSGLWFTMSLLSCLLLGSASFLAVWLAFRKRGVFIYWIFFFLWLGGVALAQGERIAMMTLPAINQPVSGEVRVVSDPEERDFYRQIRIRFEHCEAGSCPATDVLWRAPLSFTEPAGTRLSFACELTLPENFDPEFDYRMFLAKDGIGYLCLRATEARVLPLDWVGRLRGWLYVPKHMFEQGLSQILSEPEAGLAKGLLLGGNRYLPQALQDAFTRVGLSHMIAVSGYNITLIAEFLLIAGLMIGLWRHQAVWMALVGIVFFILMIGLPASAARAGTMAGIVFVALQTGRLARPVNALLFALAIMLLFHSLLLRYDLGLQLSFLATLGILLLGPYYEHIAPQGVILKKIGEILYLTLVVELFVLPVILLVFHTFSPLIIIGNFLVLLVPIAMALAFLATLLFILWPGAHVIVAWGAFLTLTLMTRSVEWLGTLQGSVAVQSFPLPAFFFWYILLGVGVYYLQRCVSVRYEKV